MSTLIAGKVAPDFTLPTIDGKSVNLQELLQRGPVLLAFFKISCPVCQYGFPFYERLAQAHKNSGASFLGICQNSVSDARAFAREYGVSFPVAIDNDANDYQVSNAYGLTNVPTLFYIAPDAEIEVSSVGWVKAEIDDVNRRLAELHNQKAPALWRTGEDIPAFRAG
jgi:peroxiredoxin